MFIGPRIDLFRIPILLLLLFRFSRPGLQDTTDHFQQSRHLRQQQSIFGRFREKGEDRGTSVPRLSDLTIDRGERRPDEVGRMKDGNAVLDG